MALDGLATRLATGKEQLLACINEHACVSHPFFARLQEARLTTQAAARLLRNYDAHAALLRRLLLKAATLMPEPAVGFVLENVRNEYGNGDYANSNHARQLREVASLAGVDDEEWNRTRVEPGVQRFISEAGKYYFPRGVGIPRAAVAAGAITATEMLAIKEFAALQTAFAPFGLAHHIWFDHVAIEEHHSDESLQLALYFIEERNVWAAVERGLRGILDANLHLYDGLLAAVDGADS